MAVQPEACDDPWMTPAGCCQEVAPGGGRAYAGPKTAAAALADDPFHDDWAHWPAE